jgi:hypothetical protein
MQRSVPFLWGLVIILLILNLVLLFALNLARLTAIETLDRVDTMLDDLSNEVIVYNVELNQPVPLKADVPFSRTMQIPLNTVIPIDQVLSVPLKTPTGDVVLDVPVKTDFPINMDVPVDFNETINVDTVVHLNTTVPVEIDIGRTSLVGYLGQAKLEIAKLRNRLTLGGIGGAADRPAAPVPTQAVSGLDSQPALISESPSGALPGASMPSTGTEATSRAAQTGTSDSDATPDKAHAQAALGLCAHVYWPLQPGTEWTYNSPTTSYIERVDNVVNDKVDLSTQYEGREIQASLTCYLEGLGGNYLGDMRRITELGELNFSNPRGMFLPRPSIMEEIGGSWTQELNVTGTVQASLGDQVVKGSISRGRAVAVYTPTGFEVVDTPLGPQEALRVEQKLGLDLNIDFELGDQKVPAMEMANLTTVYWFAKDIGLVKEDWQGGTIQGRIELSQFPDIPQVTVPALPADQLLFLCTLSREGTPECARMPGVSQSGLTVPPEAELAVQTLILPDDLYAVGGDLAGSDADQTGQGPAVSQEEPPENSAGADEQPGLLTYSAAMSSLAERLSDAAQAFGDSALKYRDGQITLEDFQSKFLEFAPEVQGLIQEVNRLSPPPQAEAVHQKFRSGLTKCDQAVGLMDKWFDTRDSGTKDAVVLLVGGCFDEVTAAQNELTALVEGR